MNIHTVVIGSGILLINLFNIPLVIAHNLSSQLIVESLFTQSIKDGYTSLKSNVEDTMSNLTDDKKTDAEKYIEQHDKDRKTYQNEMKKVNENYIKARKEAQRTYMKYHSQLPIEEDIEKDMELIRNDLFIKTDL